jgi:hypothetical protein
MLLTPRLRKLALTAHVTSSVGWLGAVAGFLALAVAGLLGKDQQRVRAAYLAAEMVTWSVIVPLSFASLLSGLVSALGTSWGLFRYYWVLVKLLLTVGATILLLVHTRPIGVMAAAAQSTSSGTDLRSLQIQLVVDSAAALLVLLVSSTLGVFKPGGLTRYGWRTQRTSRANAQP